MIASGDKFGRLTAVSPIGGGRWSFVCDCGTAKGIRHNKVRTGHTQSCGCLRLDSLKRTNALRAVPDLTGQRFGRLVVTKMVAKVDNHTYWDCRCDCGVVTCPSANKLRNGSTVSCGCYKRHMLGHRTRGMAHPGGRPNSEVLTLERLKHLLILDESLNLFRGRFTRGGRPAGEIAGHQRGDGYWIVCLDRKKYAVHRLIWFWHHGTWPVELDHDDLDRGANAMNNLREATRTLNNANHPCRRDSRLGVKGVFQNKGCDRFYARISCSGQRYSLGGFATREEANEAYFRKAKELFGDFARAA